MDPVRVKVPVVKSLYVVPASREAVMLAHDVPLNRCHCIVGAGSELLAAVKVALLPAHIVEELGWEETVGTPIRSPTAKSLKDVTPVAEIDVAAAVPRVVADQVLPSSLRITKLAVLAAPFTSPATNVNVGE